MSVSDILVKYDISSKLISRKNYIGELIPSLVSTNATCTERFFLNTLMVPLGGHERQVLLNLGSSWVHVRVSGPWVQQESKRAQTCSVVALHSQVVLLCPYGQEPFEMAVDFSRGSLSLQRLIYEAEGFSFASCALCHRVIHRLPPLVFLGFASKIWRPG